MYDVPDLRTVKREDLDTPSTSTSRYSSQSPELDRHDAQAHNPFEYDFIDQPKTNTEGSLQTRTGDDEEQTFSFRLFASSAKDQKQQAAHASESGYGQRITLRAVLPVSSIPLSEGRFLRPKRPESYYFTASLSVAELKQVREQYISAAVSSEELLSAALQTHWPGTALPWRVIHIPAPRAPPQSKRPTNIKPSTSNKLSKRPKPNKKRRIHLRKLLAAQEASAKAILRANETAEDKEQALREKKSAKNRKNQLRRREKERQKKAEANASTDKGAVIENGDVVGGADDGED